MFLGLPIALLALHAPAVVIASGALLAGAGNMIFNSLWETALQQHIPPAALSRVSAYDWFGSLAFAPLGLVIAGPAAVGDRGERDTLDRSRGDRRDDRRGGRDPERSAAGDVPGRRRARSERDRRRRGGRAQQRVEHAGLTEHLVAAVQHRTLAANRNAEVVELGAVVVAGIDAVLLPVQDHDARRAHERLRHEQHTLVADDLDLGSPSP